MTDLFYPGVVPGRFRKIIIYQSAGNATFFCDEWQNQGLAFGVGSEVLFRDIFGAPGRFGRCSTYGRCLDCFVKCAPYVLRLKWDALSRFLTEQWESNLNDQSLACLESWELSRTSISQSIDSWVCLKNIMIKWIISYIRKF